MKETRKINFYIDEEALVNGFVEIFKPFVEKRISERRAAELAELKAKRSKKAKMREEQWT